jgi:uncharacterized membrane protein
MLNFADQFAQQDGLASMLNMEQSALSNVITFKYPVDVLCRFGAVILAFFFSSSQLTKYKSEVKKNVEEDFKPGGQRDW